MSGRRSATCRRFSNYLLVGSADKPAAPGIIGDDSTRIPASGARLLVAVSEHPPVITYEEYDGDYHERVVTVAEVEIHRCLVPSRPTSN